MTLDILRKYLLSGVAFSPEGDGGAPDDVLDVDPEDDEKVDDPAGEGDQDDDNEDDPDEGAEDDDGGGDEPGPQSRGGNQFSRLRETNRELARRDVENTRRLAELEEQVRRGPPQHFQPQETPQQREARLSLLSPDERYQTEMREFTSGMQQQMHQLRQQSAADADRAHFASITSSNKVAKRFEAEVDKRFRDFQLKGVYVERHVILKNLLGERVLAQADKGEKKRPAENRRRQAARPQRGASDALSNRRGRGEPGSAADYEERYGDIPI